MSALEGRPLYAQEAAVLERLWPRADWRRALLELGGLVGLVHASDEHLLEYLTPRALAALRASLDLPGLYRLAQDARPVLGTPAAIDAHLRPMLAHLPVEHFVVLCLNARNTLLHLETVAVGTASQCPVEPRAVFAPALRTRAVGIVVAHNHPSGLASESPSDVALTRQLSEAGRALCIRVLDHVIVAHQGYVSLSARGLMGPQY